jgi:hypothetical protein
MGDAVTGWAEPSIPTAKHPRWKVGDRVWATFEDGDLNRPVYIARQLVYDDDLARRMKYCGTDTHTLSQGNVRAGTFTTYLSHSDIVEDEAIEVYVNDVLLPPNWWSIDAEQGIFTLDSIPSWMKVGEDFRFGYWWRKPGVTPPYRDPIDPMFIAARGVTAASYTYPTTSVALPTGTQPGHLLIYAGMSGYGVPATCPDPRMTAVPNVAQVWGRGCGVWYGYADEELSPLQISIQGNANATGQFSIGLVSAWDGPDSKTLRVTGTAANPEASSTTSLLVAPPGDPHAAINVYLASGGIGGVYGAQNWGKSSPYSLKAGYDQSYVEIDMALAFDLVNPIGTAVTPNTDSGTGWGAVTFGIEEDR